MPTRPTRRGSITEEAEPRVPNRGIDSSGNTPDATGPEDIHVIGKVLAPDVVELQGFSVKLLRYRVDGQDELGSNPVTPDGSFHLKYSPTKAGGSEEQGLDLVARVFGPDGKPLAESPIHVNVGPGRTTIDITVPPGTRAGPAEFDALLASLQRAGAGSLARAPGKTSGPQLEYLAAKSRWDARLVAMGIMAARFSTEIPKGALPPPFLYALFRAGVPANRGALGRLSPKAAAEIWGRAVDERLIAPQTPKALAAATRAFADFAAKAALEGAPVAGTSSLAELLEVSLGKDKKKARAVVDAMARAEGDTKALWTEIGKRIGVQARDRLKRDVEIADLTLGNAKLVRALHEAVPAIDDEAGTEALALTGYADPAKWVDLLEDAPIPEIFSDEVADERRERYAEALATQVRLAHPVATMAQRVRTGLTRLDPKLRNAAADFLQEHSRTYRLGEQPLSLYLAQHKVPLDADVAAELQKLERVYQMTPNDTAMDVLLKAGVHSAYQVVQRTAEEFRSKFEAPLGGAKIADTVYAKAQSINATTTNLVVSTLTALAGTDVGPGGMFIKGDRKAALFDRLKEANPPAAATLEKLVGSLDYCACEHCRSVLGPAAYLVSLLQLCDPDTVPADKRPIAELERRRPDIVHLPLTCENTNTPVPVIDIVNETLEYFVAAEGTKPAMSIGGFEGHTTPPEADPADILAEPQKVKAAAYANLREARFPLALPFNEPLESMRLYLRPFGTSLAGAMEALRVDERLDRGTAAYGWRDILIEELALSREEYALMTDRSLALQTLYGYPAGPFAVTEALRNGKAFSRRLGLTYDELLALLRTRFVNPNAWLLPLVERLGVSFTRIKAFKDAADVAQNDAEFLADCAAGLDPADYGGSIPAWVRTHADAILGLLTLQDTGPKPDLCSFDHMRFRRADGTDATRIDFVRLIRFVRLWKKLRWMPTEEEARRYEAGRAWSIEEVDAALCAVYPLQHLPLAATETTNLQRLDAGWKILLPRLGALLRVARLLNVNDGKALRELLACFAPMQGVEAGSLYRSLFLSSSFLRLYPDFKADASRQLFASAAATLGACAEPLQAACQLTADEWAAVLQSSRLQEGDTVAVELPPQALQSRIGHLPTPAEAAYVQRFVRSERISSVFRRAWLARRLRLSPVELASLLRRTGLDPFGELAEAADGRAPNACETLIRLVHDLRDAGLPPSEALLLFWNDDRPGATAAARQTAHPLAAALRQDLSEVDRSLADGDDPASERSRALVEAVASAEFADIFFGLIERTRQTEVPYAGGPLSAAVEGIAGPALAYEDHPTTRLVYTEGAMPDALRDDLLAAGQPQPFNEAVTELHRRSNAFLNDLPPALKQAHDDFVSGNGSEDKRRTLLARLTAELKPERKRQAALDRAATALAVPRPWIQALLTDRRLLRSAGDPSRAALHDLLAVDLHGVKGAYTFAPGAAAGAPPDDVDDLAGAIDYANDGPRALPANGNAPGQAITARWQGWLAVPAGAPVVLYVETDANSPEPLLSVDGRTLDLQAEGSVECWRTTEPQTYDTPMLLHFELELPAVRSRAALLWRFGEAPLAPVPAQALFTQESVDHASATVQRALRALLLRQRLNLTDAESLALFGAKSLARIAGGEARPWLWALPVDEVQPQAVAAAELGEVLRSVLGYASVRRRLEATDGELQALIENPSRAIADAAGAFGKRSKWTGDHVDALLLRFGKTVNGVAPLAPDRSTLSDPRVLTRVSDAMALLGRLAARHDAILQSITNAPSDEQARSLYGALRARHDPVTWRSLIKPVNDALRARRRDALVARVLNAFANDNDPARRQIDTDEKLYEHLLLDTQMHPRVETSRVREAIASVQQFISRCVEQTGAEPADLHVPQAMRDQWPWMKRYRVWEANRKVLLYPENWLEPELRDDQSPIFRESLGELLQGDITEERAAEALVGYLARLDEVAMLEPVGIHVEVSNDTLTRDDMLHVIARSAGGNRKYFYRRREPSGWTPWEPIRLDIEDNPVLPVVWKRRLFLFWVKVLQEAGPAEKPTFASGNGSNSPQTIAGLSPQSLPTDPPKHTFKVMLCWSHFSGGAWAPARSSTPERAPSVGKFGGPGQSRTFNRGAYQLSVEFEGDSMVVLFEVTPASLLLQRRIGFRMHNAFAEPEVVLPYRSRELPGAPGSPGVLVSEPLIVPLSRWIGIPSGAVVADFEVGRGISSHTLLQRQDAHPEAVIRAPQHQVTRDWHLAAPFLYHDSKHVFLVQPTVEIKSPTVVSPARDHDFPSRVGTVSADGLRGAFSAIAPYKEDLRLGSFEEPFLFDGDMVVGRWGPIRMAGGLS